MDRNQRANFLLAGRKAERRNGRAVSHITFLLPYEIKAGRELMARRSRVRTKSSLLWNNKARDRMCLLDQEPTSKWFLQHLFLPAITLWWDIKRRPNSPMGSAFNVLARFLQLVVGMVTSKCPQWSSAHFTLADTCLIP